MGNAAYVSTGKPKTSGWLHMAPVGTALPTSCTESLNAAFVDLGYISEDGVTNSSEISADTIKAWGGDTVITYQESKDDGFKWKLIESMNADVLKLVYGDSNVTGTLATGLAIKATADDLDAHAFVIDMVLKGGYLKRITIPEAKVVSVSDVVYKDNEAVGYETELKCTADSTGGYHYEYISAAS